MIIKDKEIIKVIHFMGSKLDFMKHTKINTMDVEIGDVIKIIANAKYNNVDTTIHAVAKVDCTNDQIRIKAKGVVKYGFISLDLNKIAKQYVKNNDYVHQQDDLIIIKNEYLDSIKYGDGKIELELK